MAKRFDNDFDAEGFVENFRAKDDAPAPRTPAPPRQVKTVIKKNAPDEAPDYRSQFIDDLKYRFPPAGWPQVKIDPRFKARIVNLENLCGNPRANLSTFINNVLEQHFRDYEQQIKELKDKYTDYE